VFDNIKPIDPVAQRRRRLLIAVLAFLVMLSGYLYYELKNYPEERKASRFFEALQRQDFQGAYRLWQPASSYTFKDFSEDWGRDGIQGPVQRFHITGSTERGSGVIVRVLVNGKENVSLWVEKKDKSLSFPP
jgi:hypothetical protein